MTDLVRRTALGRAALPASEGDRTGMCSARVFPLNQVYLQQWTKTGWKLFGSLLAYKGQ